MDSFELNKIMGALLATCLGVLTLNIAAGAIFTPGKLEKPGYAIAVPDKPGATETAKPEPAEPIAVRLASSDVAKGQAAANRVGPNLYGIVDRAKGAVAGFNYSAALKAKGGEWTYENLDAFLASPKTYIPGTSMGYAGLTRGGQRADLINYLHTLSDNPVPLPKAADAAPAEKK
jgi:cytochrome c